MDFQSTLWDHQINMESGVSNRLITGNGCTASLSNTRLVHPIKYTVILVKWNKH